MITTGPLGRQEDFGHVTVRQSIAFGRWQQPTITVYSYSEPFTYSYAVLDDITAAIDRSREWDRDTGNESISEG